VGWGVQALGVCQASSLALNEDGLWHCMAPFFFVLFVVVLRLWSLVCCCVLVGVCVCVCVCVSLLVFCVVCVCVRVFLSGRHFATIVSSFYKLIDRLIHFATIVSSFYKLIDRLICWGLLADNASGAQHRLCGLTPLARRSVNRHS
jgi:hypothetical protein